MFGFESPFDQTFQIVIDIFKDYILDEFSLIIFGVEEILTLWTEDTWI